MVCKAFSVLTVIVKIERHAHMFADANSLNNMCERIALPNISMRSKFLKYTTISNILNSNY